MQAYAELFERGARERPEDLARAMAGIERESRRMGDLVDELLLLARLDQGRPLERVPVDLAELAREAVDAARALEPSRPWSLDAPDTLGGGRRSAPGCARCSTTCSATCARTRLRGRPRG